MPPHDPAGRRCSVNATRDWQEAVRDFYGHGLRAEHFIADTERLLADYRALSVAYASAEPADTFKAVENIGARAAELVRALRCPKAASWIQQGAMLSGVEDLTDKVAALVVAADAALKEFGPPPRRGSYRQHPRLMFVAGVARAYVDQLGDEAATPENCLQDLDFRDILQRILEAAGIPASNPHRLLSQAFAAP